jgi:hypothetical protein
VIKLVLQPELSLIGQLTLKLEINETTWVSSYIEWTKYSFRK